jgi:hypothetical protein
MDRCFEKMLGTMDVQKQLFKMNLSIEDNKALNEAVHTFKLAIPPDNSVNPKIGLDINELLAAADDDFKKPSKVEDKFTSPDNGSKTTYRDKVTEKDKSSPNNGQSL